MRRRLAILDLAVTSGLVLAGAFLVGAYAWLAGAVLTPQRLIIAAFVTALLVIGTTAVYVLRVALPRHGALDAAIRQAASRDALTGLPGRLGFDERLARALARYHRSGRRFALAYVDIDYFKVINDTRGHQEGDKILVEIASRLKKIVRSEDDVARVGGDEFAIILEGVRDHEGARMLAERIAREIARPRGGRPIPVSIGLALASFTQRAPEQLAAEADAALYATKRRGRDGWSVAGDEPQRDAPATVFR